MKKRLVSILLAATMLFSIAGCGGDESTEDDGGALDVELSTDVEVNTEVSGTVTMSHWMSGGTMEKISVNTVLKQFEKQYPNVEVQVNFISGDYSTKMYANLATDQETDVFMVPDADFGKWAEAGVMENLSSYIDASEVIDPSLMWNSAFARYSWDGQSVGSGDIYAIPKDISPRVLFYNKEILAEKGVAEPDKTTPMTYDEFIEFLLKVSEPEEGIYGLAQINWEGMVRSHGTSLLNEDSTETNLDDPKVIEAFQKVADMIHKHKVMPTSSVLGSASAIILFQSQRAVCYDGAIYDVANAQEFDFEWDVCPLPAWTEEPYNSGWSGSVGYAVSKNSENKELAYLVAEYFASETAQEILSSIGFNIPLYKEMANSDIFMDQESVPANKQAFVTAAEYQEPLDSIYTMDDQWYTVLGNRLQPLWNDPNVTAQELLPSVKPEIDALLK